MIAKRTSYSCEQIEQILLKEQNVYFIGIGGISMSSLAHIAKKNGYRVGGSDRSSSSLTNMLLCEDIEVHIGHEEKNAHGFTVFVYNAAINEENPEFLYAKNNGHYLIYRSDFLGYIASWYKNSVGVSGTHGKSTTTAMISSVFTSAGFNPTVLNGAVMKDTNSAYRQGSDEYLAFEACEYMDSFLSFEPSVSLVLNCELDHIDYFKNFKNYTASFTKYMQRAKECSIVNADSEGAVIALSGYSGNVLTFGIKNDADIMAYDISYSKDGISFKVKAKGEHYADITIRLSGEHNVYDALAACSVAYFYKIPHTALEEALSGFGGASRRFEFKKLCNEARVYDDYAHHPTEICASLAGARKICTGKLICVFQPHTYTRTCGLFDLFVNSFSNCDEVIFADIYAARETDTLGVSAKLLAEKTENGKYVGDFDKIAEYIKNTAQKDDIIVIMGAGDVNKIIEKL